MEATSHRRQSARGSQLRNAALAAALGLAGCVREHHVIDFEPPPWMERAVMTQGWSAAPDTKPVGTVHKAAARDEGERTTWDVRLEEGKCYFFSVVGDETVEMMGLHLVSPTQKKVVVRRILGPRAVVHYCITPGHPAGQYQFETKVTMGWGHYMVALFERPVGLATPLPLKAPPAASGQ